MIKRSLIGAGGMANEILSLFHKEYCIEHMYDNEKTGDIISNNFNRDNYYNIAVGYPQTKVKILKNIMEHEIKLGYPMIHPLTVTGHHVCIGLGSIIFPYVTLTANIKIGCLATINCMVKIGHDCDIGKMFHAAPGATISGYVTIGDRVFLGANSVVKEYVKICDNVIVGAGAVITKDITEPGKYAGVPARKI